MRYLPSLQERCRQLSLILLAVSSLWLLVEAANRVILVLYTDVAIPALFPVSHQHAVCFFLSLAFLFLSDAGARARWLIAGASAIGVMADYRVREKVARSLESWSTQVPHSTIEFLRERAGGPLTLVLIGLLLEAFYQMGERNRSGSGWLFRISACIGWALWPFRGLFRITNHRDASQLVVPFILLTFASGLAATGSLWCPINRKTQEDSKQWGQRLLLRLGLSTLISNCLIGFSLVVSELSSTYSQAHHAAIQALVSTNLIFVIFVAVCRPVKSISSLALPISLSLVFFSQWSRGFTSDAAGYLGVASLACMPIFFGEGLRYLATFHGVPKARNFRKGGFFLASSSVYIMARWYLSYDQRCILEIACWSTFTLASGYFLLGSLSWLVLLARGQGFKSDPPE